ncbi:MAG: hypothetical protein OXP66_08195 [Candidatus Tectomicrobia bacterium]|nr:hypothetical protein [Candidatus Tectomicrobia bacterium]
MSDDDRGTEFARLPMLPPGELRTDAQFLVVQDGATRRVTLAELVRLITEGSNR